MTQKIRNLLPEAVKQVLRLIFYGYERKRMIREAAIRSEQDKLLREGFDSGAKRLILFLIPGAELKTGRETISGGVLSIVSLAEVTASLGEVHHASTLICTATGDPLLLRYRNFENHSIIFRFSQMRQYFTKADRVLIHIPEFMVQYFRDSLREADWKWLRSRNEFHLNIMNQNIRYMPEPDVLAALAKKANKLTITTAHQKYCNAYYRNYYGLPLHKFSVWISPEQYERRAMNEKRNLLVVSPDSHPEKEAILEMLKSVNGLEVIEIRNLTYENYKVLIASAKWSLTFGEGLDAYLIEPIFSGAIGIAVYNEDFFTPDFRPLSTIYPSVQVLKERILQDLARFDCTEEGLRYQQEQYDLCAKYYSRAEYLRNVASFYNNQYTFL